MARDRWQTIPSDVSVGAVGYDAVCFSLLPDRVNQHRSHPTSARFYEAASSATPRPESVAARNPIVACALLCQEYRLDKVNARSAHRARRCGSSIRCDIASARLVGRSGSAYTPPSSSTSCITRPREHTIGNPAVMLSSNMIGMFSHVDAKTKPSAAWYSV